MNEINKGLKVKPSTIYKLDSIQEVTIENGKNPHELTKGFLISEYNLFKKRAIDSYNRGKISNSLNYLSFCSRIATGYPILKEFIDDEIEDLLGKIAVKIFKDSNTRHGTKAVDEQRVELSRPIKQSIGTPENQRVVFYNGQIIDSGALTEQYLNFFLENKYSVLFIIPDNNNTTHGQKTLDFINKHEKVKVFIPDSQDPVSKIKEISGAIDAFKPTHAFLHFLPADTIGFCSFILKTELKKYYIVHNDHSFWLGKACSDYFIEFRKFGHQISTIRRGINSHKLLIVPFYPIAQDIPFQGFPFERKGKIIGFSAANLYKYYQDPNLTYFSAIRDLLVRHPNFIFCLAGYGSDRILMNFIKENKLEERFFYLGKRNDFYKLVGNVDILFESYPFKGGLTFLYAVLQNIAVTGIANMKNASQTTSEFFDCEINYREPSNFEELKEDAHQLIISKEKRNERIELFQDIPNTKEEFQRRLSKIMIDNFDDLRRTYYTELSYDDEYSLNEYLGLPMASIDYNIRKLMMLKKELSLREKVHILFKLINNEDFYFLNKLSRLNVFLKLYRRLGLNR